MAQYNIYAGLGGGFGGAVYIDTIEFDSERHANEYAFDCAVEAYDGYAGMYGIRSVEEILEDEYDGDEDFYDEALGMYNEEMDSWLDYYVKEEKEDN